MSATLYFHGPYAPSLREPNGAEINLSVESGDIEVVLFFDEPEELLAFTDQIEAQTRAVLGARELLKEES